jgi:hypothetical protein
MRQLLKDSLLPVATSIVILYQILDLLERLYEQVSSLLVGGGE